MRLKKLEIFGFKSFADKTQIIFDEGVTCIVGPNGCGKSNISDSIRWVLGERSAKILRGNKMEDVIFNGTEFRKALAIAEVSLVIDNTDRGLPIDYQEVTITRRLFRSGESEYFINKTACRLKDIQDLILDTGMGSSSYSMIEQGRIDYILNAEPEERRFLIEEAAGIAKFKVKKDEAIRKLERTEENRLRLNDIVHEVQKNIQYAERQAKRAQRYQEHFEKLKNLEIRKAFFDLNNLDMSEKAHTQSEAEHTAECQELELRLSACREEQSNLNQILTGILDKYSSEDNKRHRIQSKIDQNEQTLQFHQDKRMSYASRRGQIQQENIQLTERVSKSAVDIEFRRNEIVQLQDKDISFKQELDRSESDLRSVNERIINVKSKLDDVKNEAFRIATETSKFRNDFHRILAFLESSDSHKRRQETNLRRLEEELSQWKLKGQGHHDQVERLTGELDQLQIEKKQLELEIQSITVEREKTRTDIAEHVKTLHQTEAAHKMLLQVHSQYEIGSELFLEDNQEFALKELIKGLRDICSVHEGSEWALEAALEGFSKSFVAGNFESAKKLIERIRHHNKAGIGVFISGHSSADSSLELPPPQHPLIRTALKDVVNIEPAYQAMLHPFISNVYVLHTNPNESEMNSLWEMSQNYKFVSPDGTVIGFHKKIYLRKGDLSYEYSSFQRESEIKHLADSILSLESVISQKQIANDTLDKALQTAERNLENIESRLLDAKIQRESFDSHQKGVVDRILSLDKEIQLITFEMKDLEIQCQQSHEQRVRLESTVIQSENQEKNIRESQDLLAQELESLEKEKSEIFRHVTEIRTKFNHLQEQIELIRHSLHLLEEHTAQDQNRLTELSAENDSIDHREKELTEQDDALRQQQELLDQERRQSEIALEFIRREKDSAEQALQVSRTQAETLQSEVHRIQNELHEIAIKKMDLNYQKKNIGERLLQSYKLKLADYAQELFQIEGSVEALESEINQLRDKVESIGTVNLLAIDEYEELKKRYEFLQNQMKDLEQARDSLMETIRQINRTTKTLFQDTFASVQQNFQEYYQTLFRGGIAKLVLTDETNPLESGVDIVVRPPGKKLQNIRLLSGGEKALTAIALLFALFKIKPSPFSVLDEVDAPLDEANIDRFLNVLKTFLTLSQFIIVTHNRKTIAMGDALYGVTMEEAGISKLVSVKVSQDKKIIPVSTVEESSSDSEIIPENNQEPSAEQIPQ